MSTSVYSFEKLNDLNYFQWRFKMKMVLIKEKVWQIINETDEKPNEGKK